jgi:hypothetical protein
MAVMISYDFPIEMMYGKIPASSAQTAHAFGLGYNLYDGF